MALRSLLLLVTLLPATVAWTSSVPIATFDGAKATTLEWQTVNDPVMGGQSMSTFHVDSGRRLGVWTGEVKIVPFLKAPGFCNLQSPGLGKVADFPDLSSVDGIQLRAREANRTGLSHFNLMLMSKGARHLFQRGVYTANFTVATEIEDIFVPWSAFVCTWRGEMVSWCPEITTQLNLINSAGVGTAFPGSAGPFSLEIESLVGSSPEGGPIAVPSAPTFVDFATFDGKAPHRWHSENDPVMGGQSSSSVEVVANSYADYVGATRIVPSLKAPGFTIAMTEGFPLYSRFPDISSMDGIVVSLRSVGANYSGFKIAFCDSHINYYRCQFASFKADLPIPPAENGDFQDIFVPWSKFSDKWDAATGKHTAENPPKETNLRSISQLQIWTEAVEGDFNLQFKYIRASKAPANPAITNLLV